MHRTEFKLNKEKVLSIWLDAFRGYGIDANNLFETAMVMDEKEIEGSRELAAWWPREQIRSNHVELQKILIKGQRWGGPDDHLELKGFWLLLESLYRLRGDVWRTVCFLMLASMHQRTKRNRDPWGMKHAPAGLWQFEQALQSELEDGPSIDYIPHQYTRLMPEINEDYTVTRSREEAGAAPMDLEEWIGYLALESVKLLSAWAPMILSYGDKQDPEIYAEAVEQLDIEKLENQRRYDAAKEAQQRAQVELEERKQKHPKCDEWPTVTKEQLEAAVWSKTMTEVAKDYGVSDVMIGKRCRQLNIERPPQGFWLSVDAGNLPHPHGKPYDVAQMKRQQEKPVTPAANEEPVLSERQVKVTAPRSSSPEPLIQEVPRRTSNLIRYAHELAEQSEDQRQKSSAWRKARSAIINGLKDESGRNEIQQALACIDGNRKAVLCELVRQFDKNGEITDLSESAA